LGRANARKRYREHCIVTGKLVHVTKKLVREGFIDERPRTSANDSSGLVSTEQTTNGILEEFKKRSAGAQLMPNESTGHVSWMCEIEELQQAHLFRVMPAISGPPGRSTNVNGHDAVNFSSNNYLALANHPAIVEAAVDFTRRFGASSTASRLISGSTEPHRELESFVAEWKETEAALVFASGYQANVGLLSALVGRDDLILSDELNHASIVDGCRLSRAQVAVYPHLDLGRLEDLLKPNRQGRKLVVTESVFSMDGDVAPLREIDGLCKRHGALLMVDEAHGAGVAGPKGRGLAAAAGIVPEIQMGTLGKAVGTYGAYVAGSRCLINLLINRARPFVYTTAVPPGVVGSALVALKIIASEEGARRRTALEQNKRLFASMASEKLDIAVEASHIVPVRVGESEKAMRVSSKCLAGGIFVHGIRYPTVPEGTARLRFTLMSDHTPEDLSKAVSVVARVLTDERDMD
jgi:8-amino-7-oxononanoate synthase